MARSMTLAAVIWFALAYQLSAATIIVVRHAERGSATNAPMTDDAPLSSAGQERAARLDLTLKDSGIRRIFVTEFRRTQQTAEPLAARLRLKPVIIPQKNMDALIDQLRKLPAGETVLVVGHANTVPRIVDRLGAGSAAPMADSEYDRLTIVFIGAGAQSVTLRYGKPTQ